MGRSGCSVLVAALVAVPLGPAHAQRPATWVTLGMGQAAWGGFTELGAQATASHQSRGRMLTARALVGGDILGGVLASSGEVIGVQDLGVLVGLGSKPGLVHFSLGAGLGLATITHKGGSSDTKVSRLGVPLEGQVFLQPTRFLGVGIYAYGDLNKERSFWGWSISVALGRIR